MGQMSRIRISPDAEPPRQEVGKNQGSSAPRGFIDDIAVLFAIMVGRDMVQRYAKALPDESGKTDPAPEPH